MLIKHGNYVCWNWMTKKVDLKTMTSSSPVISITQTNKVFNQGTNEEVIALKDINLDIRPSEFISFIGPSGCGKSTLLRLIADLDQPTSGSLTVNGKTPAQARLAREYGFLASRGADFHGPGESRIDIGKLPPFPANLTPVWTVLI